jgi:hypothetical protein
MDKKSPPRPKNQHYVPCLHLGHFIGASPRGMIWTYDIQKGTSRPSKIEETGAQTNFYSPKDADGSYRDDLEHWFGKVESEAAAGYRNLLNGEIPTGNNRAAFSTFVSSLHLRTPAKIRSSAEGYGKFIQTILNFAWRDRAAFDASIDQYEVEHGPIDDRDRLFDFHNDKDSHTIEVDMQLGLTILSASDRIQEILFSRDWYVLHAEGGTFITSDNPVHIEQPPCEPSFYGPGGFTNPAAQITLPLSPTKLLLITGEHHSSSQGVAPPSFIQMMNEARAHDAERFLYAHHRSDEITRLGEQFKDVRAGFQVDGGGEMAKVTVRR